jgi:hypothetical protein
MITWQYKTMLFMKLTENGVEKVIVLRVLYLSKNMQNQI